VQLVVEFADGVVGEPADGKHLERGWDFKGFALNLVLFSYSLGFQQ